MSYTLPPPPPQELQHFLSGRQSSQREASVQQGAPGRLPLVLRYPLPYPQDPSPPPLVPQRPAELQYGNPYSTDPGGRSGWASSSTGSAHFNRSHLRLLLDFSEPPPPPPPPQDHAHRPPPEAPPTCAPPCAPPLSPSHSGPWDQEAVVCIQPSRSASPPEGAEETHKVSQRERERNQEFVQAWANFSPGGHKQLVKLIIEEIILIVNKS